MKIVSKILAVLLALTIVGCYHHPNPIARDASYGATYGALPGIGLMSILAADDDSSLNSDEELGIFGLSLIVMAGGAVAGLAIGTIVGVVHWMYETATWDPSQEQPAALHSTEQVESSPEYAQDGEYPEGGAVDYEAAEGNMAEDNSVENDVVENGVVESNEVDGNAVEEDAAVEYTTEEYAPQAIAK